VFASLHAVLYFVSFGLWRNWAIYLESVEGVVLGPRIGFFAALTGSLVARMIRPDDFWMFGIVAEPVSVLIAGLLSRANWKPVLAAYAVMMSAYLVSPFGRVLPVWAILDILFALLLIYPTSRISGDLFKMDGKRVSATLILISFVCIATDSLVRIFLLVPCGLYNMFFPSFEALYGEFAKDAVSSYAEDLIVVLVSFLVGTPLIVGLSKMRVHELPDDNS
jgi:hypothetical protein